MAIELRPRGVACNIACKYCYQNAERDAGRYSKRYDLDTILNVLKARDEVFTLFGGEPLMMPLRDLEVILKWGYERFGQNSIQTNGLLITDAHIALFQKFNVHVGLSIDGPGELNDVRWQRSLEQTRKNTAAIERMIYKLCDAGLVPSLIVTLHRGNVDGDRIFRLQEWFRELDGLGIASVRLHLLEVDQPDVRRDYALTAGENTRALLTFLELEKSLENMRFDLTSDLRNLLLGKDEPVSCVWRACDPFHTEAVKGVEGNGKESKCGRVNKDGIDYLRPDSLSYERYIALYQTTDESGGCKGCRFFLMCKGQCPGTGIDGDWRKKSEHCETWKHLFSYVEQQLVEEGHTPLSLHPVRTRLEHQMLESWKRGSNPTISRLSWQEPAENAPYDCVRQAWLNQETKSVWRLRFHRIESAMNQLAVENAVALDGAGELTVSFGLKVPATTDSGNVLSNRNYLDLGRRQGLAVEMRWLETLIRFNKRSSRVNGISETKTPIMKLICWDKAASSALR